MNAKGPKEKKRFDSCERRYVWGEEEGYLLYLSSGSLTVQPDDDDNDDDDDYDDDDDDGHDIGLHDDDDLIMPVPNDCFKDMPNW